MPMTPNEERVYDPNSTDGLEETVIVKQSDIKNKFLLDFMKPSNAEHCPSKD
jgi:hypothetical protein